MTSRPLDLDGHSVKWPSDSSCRSQNGATAGFSTFVSRYVRGVACNRQRCGYRRRSPTGFDSPKLLSSAAALRNTANSPTSTPRTSTTGTISFGQWKPSSYKRSLPRITPTEHAQSIHKAATPGSATILGRAKRLDATQVAVWEARMVDVMRQKVDLKELLLATGDKVFVERPLCRADKLCAVGANGDGRNTLDVLLMELHAASLATADTTANTSSDAPNALP